MEKSTGRLRIHRLLGTQACHHLPPFAKNTPRRKDFQRSDHKKRQKSRAEDNTIFSMVGQKLSIKAGSPAPGWSLVTCSENNHTQSDSVTNFILDFHSIGTTSISNNHLRSPNSVVFRICVYMEWKIRLP